MGKNTKNLMDSYQKATKEEFEELRAGIDDSRLALAMAALKQKTEVALITSVAGVLIDSSLINPTDRIYADSTDGYNEVLVLKRRLAAIDKLISELKVDEEE